MILVLRTVPVDGEDWFSPQRVYTQVDDILTEYLNELDALRTDEDED